ncbi:hypothetical protein ACNKHL_26380 [Shigella flexneri]
MTTRNWKVSSGWQASTNAASRKAGASDPEQVANMQHIVANNYTNAGLSITSACRVQHHLLTDPIRDEKSHKIRSHLTANNRRFLFRKRT